MATMNADRTVTANYVTPLPVTHTLTVTSTNPGSGVAITLSLRTTTARATPTTFTRSYNNGVVVTVGAPATAGGKIFSSWTGCDSTSGGTCTVTMNADRTVTVNYVTLGEQAATRAKTLLRRPYVLAGKGYDFGLHPTEYISAEKNLQRI